jgi:hypothetical protein
MTLEELKNISNEIKIRNSTGTHMIKHVFIYKPSKKTFKTFQKLNLPYISDLILSIDEDKKSCFQFYYESHLENEFHGVIDIECNENGFCSYVCFKTRYLRKKSPNKYRDLCNFEIYGVIRGGKLFQYQVYTSIAFYKDADICPGCGNINYLSYQEALKKRNSYLHE